MIVYYKLFSIVSGFNSVFEAANQYIHINIPVLRLVKGPVLIDQHAASTPLEIYSNFCSPFWL